MEDTTTRHIYLMTYYQTQTCVENADPYILVQKVKNQGRRRLSKTKGNVNFTDLWFHMVDSVDNLEGKYVAQHFSLLSDTDAFSKGGQTEQVQYAFIALIKINEKFLLQSRETEEDQRTTIHGIGQEMEAFVENKDKNISCVVFRTLDNADLILFGRTDTLDRAEKAVKSLFLNYQNVLYSLYPVIGKLCGKEIVKTENVVCKFKLTEIRHLKDAEILPKNELKSNISCEEMIKSILEIMQRCSDDEPKSWLYKNKKWLSYYQTLYQIVSFMMQYTQADKLKDLYYILFPSLELFFCQLKSGLELLDKTQEKPNRKKEEQEQLHSLNREIEDSVSSFIDNMELLIHHIGTNCSDIMNAAGQNGLAYDVPVRLCMLYLSALYETTMILNDKEYKYQFLIEPLAYSRPNTRLFKFGLPPENRLIQVRISRHQIYSPRALLAILVHEGNHYIGQESRLRTLRAEKYTRIAVTLLLEKLLPNSKLEIVMAKRELDESMRGKLRRDWNERKCTLLRRYCPIIQEELLKQNKEREHKYHFKELYDDICYIIKTSVIGDHAEDIYNSMNHLNIELRLQMQLSTSDVQQQLLDIIEEEQCILKEAILNEVLSEDLYNQLGTVRDVMKEAYADYGSILILKLEPLEYLESYLLSEGCQPSDDTINSMLINRVAMVHEMISLENEDWKEKWANASEEEWENPYLIKIKKSVDVYLRKLKEEPKTEEDPDGREDSLGYFDVGKNDPLLYKECVLLEQEYLEQAYQCLKNWVDRTAVSDNLKKIQTIYSHFKVYGKGEEKSYQQFFEDLDRIVEDYKSHVRSNEKAIPDSAASRDSPGSPA